MPVPPSNYLQLHYLEESGSKYEIVEGNSTTFRVTEGAAFYHQDVSRFYLQKKVTGCVRFHELSAAHK